MSRVYSSEREDSCAPNFSPSCQNSTDIFICVLRLTRAFSPTRVGNTSRRTFSSSGAVLGPGFGPSLDTGLQEVAVQAATTAITKRMAPERNRALPDRTPEPMGFRQFLRTCLLIVSTLV